MLYNFPILLLSTFLYLYVLDVPVMSSVWLNFIILSILTFSSFTWEWMLIYLGSNLGFLFVSPLLYFFSSPDLFWIDFLKKWCHHSPTTRLEIIYYFLQWLPKTSKFFSDLSKYNVNQRPHCIPSSTLIPSFPILSYLLLLLSSSILYF